MQFYASRAMQISQLNEDEIERLHSVEKRCGYCLPNWNIQEIFKKRPLLETLGIPEDENAQSKHARRIESDIAKEGLLSMAEGEGNISCLCFEKTHSFDWVVYNSLGKIVYEYIGGHSRKKLMDQLA